MKKVIAYTGLMALGVAIVQPTRADWMAGADKPWIISGTLRGFYDDNIYTAPNQSINRVGSFGYDIRPSISLTLADGPNNFTASYAYSMKYYEARVENKIDQSHDFEMFFNHNFNEHYSIDLEDSFVISQEPDALNPLTPGSAPARVNSDNYRNTAAVNFHGQVTRELGYVVGYANSWYDYTGNPSGQAPGSVSYGNLLNRFEHNFISSLRYQVTELSILTAGYTFEYVQHTGSGDLVSAQDRAQLAPLVIAPILPSSRNNYTHTVTVGVDHTFRSDLNFSGRVGIQYVDYYNNQSRYNSSGNSTSPYADLNLSFAYAENGTGTVGYRHSHNQTDVGFQPGSNSLTQDQDSSVVYAMLVQKLTALSPRLTGTLSAQYQNSFFDGGGLNGSDHYLLAGANLTYQFTQYFSAETGYNFSLVNSDISGRGYDRNIVYVGVTASY